MCIAKARVVKCGHTVGYEILLPCGDYVANGPPCAAWDERLINKVFLKDRPVCVGCRWKKEKKICQRYVDAEQEMVRSPGGIHGASAKEVWEKRLAVGERMMRDVGGWIRRVGEKVSGREEASSAPSFEGMEFHVFGTLSKHPKLVRTD